MNIQQAKEISIIDYLNTLGFIPQKIRGTDYWYLSPFRNEKTASFKVNIAKNLFYDFGVDTGGNIIDFGIKYNGCSVPEFLGKLEGIFSFPRQKIDNYNSEIISKSDRPKNIGSYEPKKLGTYKTKKIGNNKAITDYIDSRKIQLKTASKFLCEMYYDISGKHYFGVGFKNDSGGFEIRNKYFKGCFGKKDITHIKNGSNVLNIFEGVFDFLTWWQLNKSCQNNTDIIILNSLSLLHNIEESLKIYETVHYYFDNDAAGIDAGIWLQKNIPKAKDHRMEYILFKDLNEYFTKTNEEKASWII